MNMWKILGGSALAVVAVAALPVAGPIGAITGIGALAAGTFGAAAGGVAEYYDTDEEDAKKEGKREGQKNAEREAKEKAEKIKIKKNIGKAFLAIGLACANCDGIDESELKSMEGFLKEFGLEETDKDIKELVYKITNEVNDLREKIALDETTDKDEVDALKNELKKAVNKSSIEAFSMLKDILKNIGDKKSIDKSIEDTSNAITEIIKADGNKSEEEKEFLREWEKYKKENFE